MGEIPKGQHVLHHCDNPPCVNPDHIYVGTPQDNANDRDRRGRNGGIIRSHCRKGHEYTVDNIYYSGSNRNKRCRKCQYLAGIRHAKKIRILDHRCRKCETLLSAADVQILGKICKPCKDVQILERYYKKKNRDGGGSNGQLQ